MNELTEFRKEVEACLARAGKLYDLEMQMGTVDVRIDIKGYRMAGQAIRKGYQFSLRFHPDAVFRHYDEMVKDTIPHEVAHTVCQMRPDLGSQHDHGWKAVCRALGGDDSRTHNMTFGHRPVKLEYWYRTSNGNRVNAGPQRHAKIQRGKWYSVSGCGTLDRHGYIGNTRNGDSQPVPESIAARTVAHTQPERPVASNGGTKADQVRVYIQTLLDSGTQSAMLLKHASSHAKHLQAKLGFGTYGAARSSFTNNVKKLSK
jgi:predicted SprT family Zn-dependent metalloprotease